jgi:hypothetical protein
VEVQDFSLKVRNRRQTFCFLRYSKKNQLLNELVIDAGHCWLKSPGLYDALRQVNPQLIAMLRANLSYRSNIMAE